MTANHKVVMNQIRIFASIFLLFLLFAGCGQDRPAPETSESQGGISFKSMMAPADLIPGMDGKVTITGVEGTFPMTINADGTITATIPNIPIGNREITVTYFMKDSPAIILLTAKASVTIEGGKNTDVPEGAFTVVDRPDPDRDGATNIREIRVGSLPLVSSSFPVILTVSKEGAGTGTITATSSNRLGTNCRVTCNLDYVNDASITLTAIPDAVNGFSGWSGGGCSGTGTCTPTLTGTTTVTATFTILKPKPRFAYVANQDDNTVSIYAVDAATGQLRARGYVATGTTPRSVTVDPSGKFAYVANYHSGNVSAYIISASTGALTQVGDRPFVSGTRPVSVTVDPSGKFAYVANEGSGTVSAYTIDATTGALTQVSTSPFAARTFPRSVTVDPSGKFAYVANDGSSDVSAYTISASTGALTQVSGSPFAAGPTPQTPVSVTVDPSGKFAYVANLGGNVSAYTISASTGALTLVSTSLTGKTPRSITVDPSGKFAYVANEGSNTVSAYTIDPGTGALTPLSTSPFAAGSAPLSVTVDPSGKFAYVANSNSDNVSAYTIDPSTGALTAANGLQVSGSPFAAGSRPVSVTVSGVLE